MLLKKNGDESLLYIGVSAAVRDIPSVDEYEIRKWIKSTPITKMKRAMLIACDSFEVIILLFLMYSYKLNILFSILCNINLLNK